MINLLKTIGIAEADQTLSDSLQKALIANGYSISGTGKNGEEAIQMVKNNAPQMILVNYELPLLDGFEVSKRVIPLQQTAVTLMTPRTAPDLIQRALELGVSACIQIPFDPNQLRASLDSAYHQFQIVSTLKQQMESLSETLETRKIQEKAKGILMEQQGLSEEEAHKAIQKMSQDQGLAIKEVCRSIIQVKMLLGKMGTKRAV